MTLRQLTYLTAVLECGINVSSAAQRLGVSQPNVSKQLALLEEEIGTPLFERTGRRLTSLTLAGRRIYHHAVNVTEELNRLHLDVLPQNLENTIVLGLTAFTRQHVLPGMLAAISHQIMDLSLDQELLPCSGITQAVLEGRCDIGLIVGEAKPDPDLLLLPWYRWRYRVIFSRHSGLAEKLNLDNRLIRELPIVACSSLTVPSADIPKVLDQLGISNQIDYVTPDPNEVKKAVRANGHIGIIAEMAYSEQQDTELDSCESPPPFPTMMAWIAIRRNSLTRAPIRRVLNAIAPQLSADVINRFLRLKSPSEFVRRSNGLKIPRYG